MKKPKRVVLGIGYLQPYEYMVGISGRKTDSDGFHSGLKNLNKLRLAENKKCRLVAEVLE